MKTARSLVSFNTKYRFNPLGFLGLFALLAFWKLEFGICGCLGFFGCWGSDKPLERRAAYMGFIGLIGLYGFFDGNGVSLGEVVK